MNKNDLINQINFVKNSARIYRDGGANYVLNNPETIVFLLQLIYENSSKTAIKSSWVLELVCLENLNLLAPHLNYFTKNLYKLKHESILRPISKICSLIGNNLYCSEQNEISAHFTLENQAHIIEVSFDWLINNHKIATQVYAMDTLYFLGGKQDWIHKELKLILEQNISSGSAGYKVRAKRVLKKLIH